MGGIKNNGAYYVIDDNRVIRSAWDKDFRGANTNYQLTINIDNIKQKIASRNDKYPTVYKRDFTEITSGKATLEICYDYTSGDGLYFGLYGNGEEAFILKSREGWFCAAENKLFVASYGIHHLKLELNIDSGKVNIIHDGKYMSSSQFTGKADKLDCLKVGFDESDIGETYMYATTKLYGNFLFNDRCIHPSEGKISEEYDTCVCGKALIRRRKYGTYPEDYIYAIEAKKNSMGEISRGFDRAEGTLCFETRYLIPKKNGKLTVTLEGAGKTAVSLFDEGDALCCDAGILKKHSLYTVWQTLRIEVDTHNKTALIWLNGKKASVLSFNEECDFIDRVRLHFSASETASEVLFGDFSAHIIPPLPEDYVPEPVIPKKKGDYYVGMNICSLWREGSHYGWDCISPFDEIKPVMGFYDEGIPETSDWELKYMSEHGIDAQFYCWYANESNAPLKEPRFSYQWHNAHFYAKYSDKVKFAILWEALFGGPADEKAFRKYFVPYWIDYYFSDPRYFSIDGYAIMAMYGYGRLIQAFGSAESAKRNIDYLRSEVKKLGYKDLVFLCTTGECNQLQKDCGFDGAHAYHWNLNGYQLEYNKKRNLENINKNFLHYVPTVSVGFNNLGWTGFRTPMLTPDDMEKALAWCKDELLPMYESDTDAPWKKKLVMLSTWNEFGEGTYICPSGLNGFGYLDAVRKVFLEDTPHTDIIPSENQKSRICRLYPMHRRMIAPLNLVRSDEKSCGVIKRYEFKTQADLDLWDFEGFEDLRIEDGRLKGRSVSDKPRMTLKDPEILPLRTGQVFGFNARHMSYKNDHEMCSIHVWHSNDVGKDARFYVGGTTSNPHELEDKFINVRRIREQYWQDTVQQLKLSPVYKKGYFELESFEILRSEFKYDLVIDGYYISPNYDIQVIDGEMYLPFDPTTSLRNVKEMYFEWHNPERQLWIFGTEKEKSVFTEGSDVAIVNGKEVKMARPVTFLDGIPLIPLNLFAQTIGMKVSVIGEEVRLEK